MLTDFSDAIYTELLSRLPGGQAVPRERLRGPDMPQVIAHFLEHALDRRLELEAHRTGDIAADWVDHGDEQVQLARAAYVRVLQRHAHFPAGDWPRALRQAVQLVCAYLVRPVPTLTHFVFGEQETSLPGADVSRRAGYFLPFGHLQSAVEAYVERRPTASIERRSLSEALEKVDHALCDDYDTEDWKNALMPLLDLAGQVPGAEGLPVSVVEAFFEYRSQHTMTARMRQAARKLGRSSLNEEALFEALDPTPEPEPEPLPAQPAAEESIVVSAPAGGAPDLPQPLWQQFRGSTGATAAAASDESEQTPLWMRYQSGGTSMASAPSAPAAPAAQKAQRPSVEQPIFPVEPRHASQAQAETTEGFVAVNERRGYFVGALFGGDDRQFEDVMARLQSAEDWSAASRIIGQDVYRRNRVDIYGEAAIAFTNAVEKHYSAP
jgi:hypothetical protein